MDELLFRHLRGQTTEDENGTVAAWRDRTDHAGRVMAGLAK